MLEYCLKIYHICFLLHPFQFIQSSYHWMLCNICSRNMLLSNSCFWMKHLLMQEEKSIATTSASMGSRTHIKFMSTIMIAEKFVCGLYWWVILTSFHSFLLKKHVHYWIVCDTTIGRTAALSQLLVQPHCSQASQMLLIDNDFSGWFIGRNGPIPKLPQSPDIVPLELCDEPFVLDINKPWTLQHQTCWGACR
jgi:hypothetical protein